MHRAPHQVVRYAPVLRRARRLVPGARVLEVGSGVEGIGTWLRRRFVGVDLAFSGATLAHLDAVRADATRLPFPDDTFDLVACVDVLQDLPHELVPAVCDEMARVARGVVVVVTPSGVEAERSDRNMLDWCGMHRIDPPQWLRDHVHHGLPSPDAVGRALLRHGRVVRADNTSVEWHERLFRAEHVLRSWRAMTVLQPVLRAWGRTVPFELPGRPPAYRFSFTLETHATSSPPRRAP